MSRQSRLIAILAVLGLLGAIVLGVVAQRYSRIVAARDAGGVQSPEQARGQVLAQIDLLIAVRTDLRQVISASGLSSEMGAEALRVTFAAERDRLLRTHRVHPADYRELRARYARFLRADPTLETVWREGFAVRSVALKDCDLGAFETLGR